MPNLRDLDQRSVTMPSQAVQCGPVPQLWSGSRRGGLRCTADTLITRLAAPTGCSTAAEVEGRGREDRRVRAQPLHSKIHRCRSFGHSPKSALPRIIDCVALMGHSKRDVTSRLIHRIDASSGCGHGGPRHQWLARGHRVQRPVLCRRPGWTGGHSRSVEGGRQLRRPQV
jgi:hypothetical protein